ncbi:hypothetical protein [Streptomyces sp. JJ38]|uniref:HalD/BesD family halogenase n=1 Tax=Streptomyces sp. JJ38 TaxID=2738128 RepID=UPI001C577E8D|nr:hypothetical protein [Streptomyces sp. JJ38]MBW1597901.1 hypothetical protein [Streptomyces sp. JJ38]
MTVTESGAQAQTSKMQETDARYEKHFADRFTGAELSGLQERFRDEHIVPIRGFCPPDLLRELQREAFGIMDEHGVDRKFSFEITDGTPRQMTTVGQPVIKDEGHLIHATYFSPAVKSLIGSIVGEEVYTCPYAGEHYVISRLGKNGDTHGWHWDDYTYGFILVLQAPDYRDGGFVQAVPHTSWDKQNPDVYGALLKSQVRSYHLEAGDAYVVKTDTTMHRVYPIRGETSRTIVNMTLASAADLTREITHETNDALFGGTGA